MKTLALAAALALAVPGIANAGGWHHDHDDAIVAGGLGLLGGMIIGGALAQPAQPVYVQPAPVYAAPGYVDPGAAHAAWCASHYRSWSAYDNTWIDRQGRLRTCVSPYFR